MTSRYSPALCGCGQPATPSSIQAGKKRCIDCSNEVVAQAAREMHAKAGPAWEAWKTGGGPAGFERARQSPRVHAARLVNIARAQAVNAARRAAEAGQDATVSPVAPPPVPPPSTRSAVPAVIFRAAR